MAIYKTVPFSEFLADTARVDTKREYVGFISKDGRLAKFSGVSYDECGQGLKVEYNDGSVSRNRFDGTAMNVFISYEKEIDLSNGNLYAIYIIGETE